MAQVPLKVFLESHGSDLLYCRERIAELESMIVARKSVSTTSAELKYLRSIRSQEIQLLKQAVQQIDDSFLQGIAEKHYIDGLSWFDIAGELQSAPVSHYGLARGELLLKQALMEYLDHSATMIDEPEEETDD